MKRSGWPLYAGATDIGPDRAWKSFSTASAAMSGRRRNKAPSQASARRCASRLLNGTSLAGLREAGGRRTRRRLRGAVRLPRSGGRGAPRNRQPMPRAPGSLTSVFGQHAFRPAPRGRGNPARRTSTCENRHAARAQCGRGPAQGSPRALAVLTGVKTPPERGWRFADRAGASFPPAATVERNAVGAAGSRDPRVPARIWFDTARANHSGGRA